VTIVRILGYIWAGTQIRRDSYEPEPLYYKCEPYVQVDDQQALPADVYVEKNGAVVPVTRVYVETGWHESHLFTVTDQGR